MNHPTPSYEQLRLPESGPEDEASQNSLQATELIDAEEREFEREDSKTGSFNLMRARSRSGELVVDATVTSPIASTGHVPVSGSTKKRGPNQAVTPPKKPKPRTPYQRMVADADRIPERIKRQRGY
jgi:hypothetical protein